MSVTGREMPTITDVRAGCVRIGVVAAKCRHGIVRAVGSAWDVNWQESLRREVLVFVGSLHDDTQWTSHVYEVPAYLYYRKPAPEWHGVYLHRWMDETQKRSAQEGERLT